MFALHSTVKAFTIDILVLLLNCVGHRYYRVLKTPKILLGNWGTTEICKHNW